MSTFTTDLRTAFYRLGQMFPGFDQILIQAMFALVTEEHVLWYSKPGRAKSQVSDAIFSLFPDATSFKIQFTKDMLPDQLFGNVIADELMRTGKELRHFEGGIVQVQFARLEEFFDGSDYLIRALLTVLHERRYESKDQRIEAPLHTVIATTNFMRQREATEAVLDRLMCKAVLDGVKDLTDCMRAGTSYLSYEGKVPPLPVLRFEDLAALSEMVQSPDGIVVSSGMQMLHVLLIQEFQTRRIEAAKQAWRAANPDVAEDPAEEDLLVPEITPRTMVKLHDFSRAAAALNDRFEVHPSDMRALGYGMLTIGDDTGDETLWHTLCDEFLPFSSKELGSLERLAEIAEGVGSLRAEGPQATSVQMRFGGQLVQGTALDLQNLLDKLKGVKHPVLTVAKKRLANEISALASSPHYGGFDLVKGW